jgi:glycyl-tRNA synthetase
LELNIKKENLRRYDHPKEKLSHYSKGTTDFEYKFPFGWGELWGVANRTDFDLTAHQTKSGVSFEYQEEGEQASEAGKDGTKFVPYVVEPSLGVDRMFLAFLSDAYCEEKIDEKDTRVVLKLHPALSPFKAAVFPLQKKEHGEKAKEIYKKLSKYFACTYDETGSVGKKYRRQDEIGTPYCLTVDDQTIENNTVTVRCRDTMKQDRVNVEELRRYIEDRVEY